MKRTVHSAFSTAIPIALVLGLIGPWGRTPLPGPARSLAGVSGNAERGARIYREMDCGRCHASPKLGRGTNVPPALEQAGERIRPQWLRSWLAHPRPIRFASEGRLPGRRMPPVDRPLRDIQDLVAYLSGLRSPEPTDLPIGRGVIAQETITEGSRLFRQYQCTGCHRLGTQGVSIGPDLDRVGKRRPEDYIARILANPQDLIPGTAMENKRLWPEEIAALTSYLVTTTQSDSTSGENDP